MSEQVLNRTIDTLMERIEKLRTENLRLRNQISRLEQNPFQDGSGSIGEEGGMVGYQPDSKNAAGCKLCGQETMSERPGHVEGL